MAAKYEANPAGAPWIRMPLLYEIHRDILGGAHQGSVEKVQLTAKQIADNINPFSGNLPDLEQFWISVFNLYDDMYDAANYDGEDDLSSGTYTGGFSLSSDEEAEAGGFASAGSYPKDIQRKYGRNRVLTFQTDISELPRVVNIPDAPLGTAIDDIIGWVRFDLAQYFELIPGIDHGDFDSYTTSEDRYFLGVTWRADDPSGFGPNNAGEGRSSSDVWDYLKSLDPQNRGPNSPYYKFIRNAITGENINPPEMALMQSGARNFCLGDLWVLSIVSLAELGIQVEDAINLVVYDSPGVAQVEAYRTTGYGGGDGYIRDAAGRVTGLAEGTFSYRSSQLLEDFGGILDRASDGGTAVEIAFGGTTRDRARALDR